MKCFFLKCNKVFNEQKMLVIEVDPRIVDAFGTTDSFGDETGTPQFYTVRDVLKKYLGQDIYVSWNYGVFTFNIESDDTDEAYDASVDFIEVIKSIREPFPEGGFYNGYQLQFNIVRVVE